ncbi:MAG: HAD family hydrolase [Gammaproteobacteria bacterium]|nr:HAD family hydrolase [Gammaproteobacteria bacterium]
MYTDDRLLILDADGTTIDAFSAIEQTFAAHHMRIGDLERFQKRRHMFKYLGGLKEFPRNLRRQLGRQKRAQLVATLTDVYREQAMLYPGIAAWLNELVRHDGLRVGIVTRNITHEPVTTLRRLLTRQQVDVDGLDFIEHVPLRQSKVETFRQVREGFAINPACAYACGDEKTDYAAALGAGMHPFMVSYGFEDFERLTTKIGVPAELISRTPAEFRERVGHALGGRGQPAVVPVQGVRGWHGAAAARGRATAG